MNIKEFNDLYQYMMDNHSWKSCLTHRRFRFKYMNFDVDSRNGSIWRVAFRECHNYDRNKWDDNKGELWFRESNNKSLINKLEEFTADCEDYNNED